MSRESGGLGRGLGLALALDLAPPRPQSLALAPDLALGSMLAKHLSALGRYDAFRAGFIGLGQSAWFMCATIVFLAANTWAVRHLRD